MGKKSVLTAVNLAYLQGFYFAITGIWPILHIASFIAVTGPKTDLWLVRTVGLVLFIIGLGLITAAVRNQVNVPVLLIAIGSAIGLTLIDIIYVLKEVIPPVYLGDAFVEMILIICWLIVVYRKRGIKL